jgi:hypothetical protein
MSRHSGATVGSLNVTVKVVTPQVDSQVGRPRQLFGGWYSESREGLVPVGCEDGTSQHSGPMQTEVSCRGLWLQLLAHQAVQAAHAPIRRRQGDRPLLPPACRLPTAQRQPRSQKTSGALLKIMSWIMRTEHSRWPATGPRSGRCAAACHSYQCEVRNKAPCSCRTV